MYIDLINVDIDQMNAEELLEYLEAVREVEERDILDISYQNSHRRKEKSDQREYRTNAIYYNEDFNYSLLEEDNSIRESEDGYVDITNLAVREIEGQLWLAPFKKDTHEIDIDNSIILKTPAYVKVNGKPFTIASATDIKFIQ